MSAPEWQEAKATLLARLGEPGFWDDEGRFAVLGGVELRDRIEAGLRSAQSLLRRIRNARRPPAALVRRAAQRLILLDAALDALAAGEPADARLRLDGDPEFGPRVAAMYRGLGARARDAPGGASRSAPAAASAGPRPSPASPPCARWRPSPASTCSRSPTAAAATTVAASASPSRRSTTTPAPSGRATIVRRYRERPTPLVRDAVRGWRTGKLDTVLAGGFDLVE